MWICPEGPQFFVPEGWSLPSKWDISSHIDLIQRVTSTFGRKKLGPFWTNPHSYAFIRYLDRSGFTLDLKEVSKLTILVSTITNNGKESPGPGFLLKLIKILESLDMSEWKPEYVRAYLTLVQLQIDKVKASEMK